MLASKKWPKLQRAITPATFFRIFSKVNQVIFSSLTIYSSILAPTVFELFCWQGKMPKFTKGHYSCLEATGPSNFLLITTNLFIKLWGSSSESIYDILLTREKNAQIYKGQLLLKYFSEFIQKLTRLSTCHYQSIHQVSSSNSFF